MIGLLDGTVAAIRTGYVLVNVGGVGYRVASTRDVLSSASEGAALSLWIHTVVREDALDLYGFRDEESLRLFELLLTVSGIGPRSALAILDIATPETLRSAIAAGNASYLTTVSGIGKKTAEKIVLELREKVGVAGEGAGKALRSDADALEAMKSLGYTAQEARDALRQVPASIESSNDRLREALKVLGSR